jgi:hypothetical protein
MTTRLKYGECAACRVCGQDVQWLGRANGWRDRGGNRECVAWIEKGEVIRPRKGTKHKPYREQN